MLPGVRESARSCLMSVIALPEGVDKGLERLLGSLLGLGQFLLGISQLIYLRVCTQLGVDQGIDLAIRLGLVVQEQAHALLDQLSDSIHALIDGLQVGRMPGLSIEN